MSHSLNILLAQINPTVGDLDGNTDMIRQVWADAPEGTDLIVFPEMNISGYPAEDLILKPSFVEGCTQHVDALAKESTDQKPWILVGTPWQDGDKTYNAAILIGDGAIQGVALKNQLPNTDVFDEKRIFAHGPLPDVLACKGQKIGVMICEDMWYPNAAAHLKSQGAEILIVPNGSPFDVKKHGERLAHARARTSETGLPLIYVNQIGGQDDLVFDGGSFVMDAGGEIIQQLPFFREHASHTYALNPSPTMLTPNGEASLPSPTGRGRGPGAAGGGEGLRSIYAALKLGLHDYVRKNGFPGVVLGMSGGIDSALSATIAVDALGSENVHCVMMPSQFTSQDSLDDAEDCAKALGCSYEVIPIDDAMAAFENTIPNLSGVAHENMQSRCRGLILMALSNSSGAMVLTTGNKSEMAVGYATLYGDMCGGFNAIKDIYKTQVYDLARWRNEQSPVIPERILTKAPSAELRPDQTDQDSLPPYDVLDDILKGLIEDDLSVDEIAARGHDIETVRHVRTLLYRNEYKRYQAAPGVKITTKAFGKDRRYPMTNKFIA